MMKTTDHGLPVDRTYVRWLDLPRPRTVFGQPQVSSRFSVDTPDYASGVVVSRSHAYVADGLSGLHVIDIADPQDPRIVGNANTQGYAYGAVVSGSHVFVADGLSGLQVLPSQCEPLSRITEGPAAPPALFVTVFPNPGPRQVTIRFRVPTQGLVRATVHDVAGRLARTLCDLVLGGGFHDLPAGSNGKPPELIEVVGTGIRVEGLEGLVLLRGRVVAVGQRIRVRPSVGALHCNR